MTDFALHPQLKVDTHDLGRWPQVRLLLHRNGTLPWFILVPESPVIDLLDLDAAERDALLGRAALVASFIKDELGWPRVNVGSLGNLVPQLHLHVVGRREGDACWPQPVWGNLPAGPVYTDEQCAQFAKRLAEVAGLDVSCVSA